MKATQLRKALVKYDNGLLYSGCHTPEEGRFCALEFVNVLRVEAKTGEDWSPKDGLTDN